MTDLNNVDEEIARLKRENAELSGPAFATGVMLTQLLQTSCKRSSTRRQQLAGLITAARGGEGIDGRHPRRPRYEKACARRGGPIRGADPLSAGGVKEVVVR